MTASSCDGQVGSLAQSKPPGGWAERDVGILDGISGAATGPPVQQDRLALGEHWRRPAQRTPGTGSRTTTVPVPFVSSADRAFKCDEETLDPARPDAALDFD
jgi:hypothetical protein